MSLRKILLMSCFLGLSLGVIAGCEKPGVEAPKKHPANPLVTSGKSAASVKKVAVPKAPATPKPAASTAAK